MSTPPEARHQRSSPNSEQSAAVVVGNVPRATLPKGTPYTRPQLRRLGHTAVEKSLLDQIEGDLWFMQSPDS